MGGLPRLTLLVAMVLDLPGCGWTELDAIVPGGADARALDARSHPEETTDGAAEAVESDASTAPDGDLSSLACSGNQATLYSWTFDSGTQGWALALDTGVMATLEWTASVGQPSLGALEVSITPKEDDGGTVNGGWLKYPHAFGDLSGRTVSAWVWLESGESPNLKVFAQTGTQYVWSDNGTVHLRPRTWTCVSLPISTPSYDQPDYDPTDVVNIGFELLGSTSFQVQIDTIRIY
jgi:hypothetical protein